MVNQELISFDPFKGTGGYVYGERFVGRQDLVQLLRRSCTQQNISIQGLPHTGKTSLVRHSICSDTTKVVSDLPVCVAYINVDACETKEDFFKLLVSNTYKAIKEQLNESNEKNRIEEFYQDIKDSGFDKLIIISQFEQTISNLHISLVLVFDRFDYVKKLSFDSYDFSKLTILVAPVNIKCIVVSIRSVSDIEEELHGKDAGSVFSQLFKSTTYVLEQFSDDDLNEYWKRLEPYYIGIGLPLDDNYKETAIYYSGRNPFLLDTYNNQIVQSYICRHKKPSPEDLRIALRTIYKSYISTLERDGLLDMAIQVILGPISTIDKDKDDKMDMLKQYDFLRIVSEKEKRALIGHDLGFVEETGDGKTTQAYAALSDYFTLLFKKDYSSRADFWQEWSATFRSLQLLCEDFLETKWGTQWAEHVEEEVVRQMLEDAKIDENANFTVSPLIEYLRESSIGKLIDSNWAIFAPVFSPIGQYSFKDHYDFVKRLRNHHAHNNTRFLSETVKTKANEYLQEIGEKIDSWFKSGKKLVITKTTNEFSLSKEQSSVSTTTKKIGINIVSQPKPNVKLNTDERLGKIFRSKNRVIFDEEGWIKWIKIDNREGFRDNNNNYEEGEWVVCRTKTTYKNGKSAQYVIDIHRVSN